MTTETKSTLTTESLTESSHTPGPWMAAASPSSIVGWPIVGPRGRAVASVHCRRGDTAEGKQINAEAGANARLIASAPDLLEALKKLKAAVNDILLPELAKRNVGTAELWAQMQWGEAVHKTDMAIEMAEGVKRG